MELYSLLPLPDDAAATFLQLINSSTLPADGNTAGDLATHFWFSRLSGNQNPKPNDLSFGLAAWLATRYPVFAHRGLSLSSWEARVDRGSGMLLRPPSRMFIDAGLDPVIARGMPIRIEGGDGLMGGAFVPSRLAPQYFDRLDQHLERSVRRLNEAEMDGAAVFGVMYEAARYAAQHEVGLYEVVDLLDAGDRSSWPGGAQVITSSSDKALAERIRLATQPVKEPGLIARLFGRGR
jgi:hypothetical protein